MAFPKQCIIYECVNVDEDAMMVPWRLFIRISRVPEGFTLSLYEVLCIHLLLLSTDPWVMVHLAEEVAVRAMLAPGGRHRWALQGAQQRSICWNQADSLQEEDRPHADGGLAGFCPLLPPHQCAQRYEKVLKRAAGSGSQGFSSPSSFIQPCLLFSDYLYLPALNMLAGMIFRPLMMP